jgi:hypothetical protein
MSEKHVLETIMDMCDKYCNLASQKGPVETIIIYQQAITSIASVCGGALAMNKKEFPHKQEEPK